MWTKGSNIIKIAMWGHATDWCTDIRWQNCALTLPRPLYYMPAAAIMWKLNRAWLTTWQQLKTSFLWKFSFRLIGLLDLESFDHLPTKVNLHHIQSLWRTPKKIIAATKMRDLLPEPFIPSWNRKSFFVLLYCRLRTYFQLGSNFKIIKEIWTKSLVVNFSSFCENLKTNMFFEYETIWEYLMKFSCLYFSQHSILVGIHKVYSASAVV